MIPVVIQARTGSTRLPGKMLMPFFEGKTIPELMVEELKRHLPGAQIVLATTLNPKDDALVMLAEKLGVSCFRGSEDNVLNRFIEAAEFFNFDACLRVCADNPFLCGRYARVLSDKFRKEDFDYLSFVLEDGTPTIRSHFGFFCEAVSIRALKKAAGMTTEKFYVEHVTNFIYGNPDIFSVAYTPVPSVLSGRRDIRLTIDTASDFEDSASLYAEFRASGLPLTAESICSLLEGHPDMRKRMAETIAATLK
jgi:spore coat polysaccharide biosynthesis protein SpsF